VELVWLAWTTPEHIKKWFTPAPWKTVECELDLRPGGAFKTVMQSPEGQKFPNTGCYLEIVKNERLVWTSALQPGYRPAVQTINKDHECEELAMTAIIQLERRGAGTRYTAIAMHKDPGERSRHEKMGFRDGWGTALDQLVDVMKGVRAKG
jgi:uncharacterized protein YndB with AHSA1/START domain